MVITSRAYEQFSTRHIILRWNSPHGKSKLMGKKIIWMHTFIPFPHSMSEWKEGWSIWNMETIFRGRVWNAAVVGMKETLKLSKRNCDNEASPTTMRGLRFYVSEHSHFYTSVSHRAPKTPKSKRAVVCERLLNLLVAQLPPVASWRSSIK